MTLLAALAFAVTRALVPFLLGVLVGLAFYQASLPLTAYRTPERRNFDRCGCLFLLALNIWYQAVIWKVPL